MSASSCAAVSAPGAARNGQIVIDYNGGAPADSYTAVDPHGAPQRSLSVPGYLRTGFDQDLTKAATVHPGESEGNPADPSTLSVSSVGKTTSTVIWRFVDDVDERPSWSPNDSQIALGLSATLDRGGTVLSPPSSQGLWVVTTTGAQRLQLVGGDVGPVAWSPDGKTIAFVPTRYGAPTGLDTIPATGGTPKSIATFTNVGVDTTTLSWSPDGRSILVADSLSAEHGAFGGSQVIAYPAARGTARPVLPLTTRVGYWGASYSPDGAELAVIVDGPDPPASGSATPSASASATTSANSPPPLTGLTLDLASADGSNLHPIATLDELAQLIGWFETRG